MRKLDEFQSGYDIKIVSSEDETADEHWPSGCVILAFVWNKLAGNDCQVKGASLFSRNGYCGRVWIGSTGEWNVAASRDNGAWSEHIPINDIVTKLRKLLTTEEFSAQPLSVPCVK